MSDAIVVCGVDPGIVNMAAWVGSFDPVTKKVKTFSMTKEDIGCRPDDDESSTTEKKKKKKKPVSVQCGSADCATRLADKCSEVHASIVVVETAPQWNVPIRLAAAAIYGVFRGRGVPVVKYSSPSTKAGAIRYFAESLGMDGELERPADGVDKLDKKASAAVRLINKRNAVRVVKRLLEFSEDTVGSAAFMSDPKKQDDMADALLLACGAAISECKERAQREKKKKKKKCEEHAEAPAKKRIRKTKKKEEEKCGEQDISLPMP